MSILRVHDARIGIEHRISKEATHIHVWNLVTTETSGLWPREILRSIMGYRWIPVTHPKDLPGMKLW
ncbi:MAG: hypothetical protein DMG06_12860 [Acidobacteria bacterium]|nr:MAG: hypothetical protein DMG06_12860 [Acidobacteriota bacterium]